MGKEQLLMAAGKKKADLVLKHGHVMNVFSDEIRICDVAICNDKIVGIGTFNLILFFIV